MRPTMVHCLPPLHTALCAARCGVPRVPLRITQTSCATTTTWLGTGGGGHNTIALGNVLAMSDKMQRFGCVLERMARDLALLHASDDSSTQGRPSLVARLDARLNMVVILTCMTICNFSQTKGCFHGMLSLKWSISPCFLSFHRLPLSPPTFDALRELFARAVRGVPTKEKDRVPEGCTRQMIVFGLSVLFRLPRTKQSRTSIA